MPAARLFADAYRNRRVLVTGHTGFKGSWLTAWLLAQGARVTGFSAYHPSTPSHFQECGLETKVRHVEGDVRDLDALRSAFKAAKPEFVFHLAAQPILRAAYDDPKLTFDTNLGGTVNVLECVRGSPGLKSAVMITSDKCYENQEWAWGYRETDRLGGKDPYSASKAAAEIACRAYVQSFLGPSGAGRKGFPRLATARAGNVIGGGDWAADRIVPDCVRAWADGKAVKIRSPHATRPWQHVLEPVSGYLWLGARLQESGRPHGEAYNFGPGDGLNRDVGELADALARHWGPKAKVTRGHDEGKPENRLLKLSIDKALIELDWRPVLGFSDTVAFTAQWYRTHQEGDSDMFAYTNDQIQDYTARARALGLAWAA